MYKSPTRRNATVDTSYYIFARAFKSPPFVVIAALLKSRSRIKVKLAIQRSLELERDKQRLLERDRQRGELLCEANRQNAILLQQLDEARASVNMPHDPAVGTHGYLLESLVGQFKQTGRSTQQERLHGPCELHPTATFASDARIGSRLVCRGVEETSCRLG